MNVVTEKVAPVRTVVTTVETSYVIETTQEDADFEDSDEEVRAQMIDLEETKLQSIADPELLAQADKVAMRVLGEVTI